jgi:hypothetical protein
MEEETSIWESYSSVCAGRFFIVELALNFLFLLLKSLPKKLMDSYVNLLKKFSLKLHLK